IRMLCPSVQPSSRRALTNASVRARLSGSFAARPPASQPIRRMRSACCARAASGQAAAPPRSEMNSRRLIIRSPGRRGREGWVKAEARARGGLHVDDDLNLGWRLPRQTGRLPAFKDAVDRQPAGLFAFENAGGVDASQTVSVGNAAAIARQTASR